jgi:predicted dienelactone hydrolase
MKRTRTIRPLTLRFSHHVVLACLCVFFMALSALSGVAMAENPVPLINQPLVPDAISPGGAAFTLTVNGTGFVSGSVVNWNGSPRATRFVSSSQVTAAILTSDIKKAHMAAVTVVNPAPGGGDSNTVLFPIALSTSIAMSESNYGVGSGSLGVSVADLNRDGKLDLVVSDNAISVLLGNGDGTFQSPVTYAVGESPTEIKIADFNGDGKLDLAVTNSVSNTVSVLLGNGDGTFQPQVQYPTGTGSYGLAAADVNADGKLDLVVTNYFANTVSVLLGNGDGTFQPHVDYAVGPVPTSIAVGDFNQDGKLDLAVTNSSNVDTVTVLLGNGDGTFSKGRTYSAGFIPRYVTSADFNGDGKLDLAVANQGDGTISILLGNGDGTFQPQVSYATASTPTSVIAADLNGDGKLDLATADNNSIGTASVLLGNGDGSFQPHMEFSAGVSANQVAVGDFDRNGTLDLAVANQGSNQVSILLQDGTVSVNPSSLNFGAQVVGTRSSTQKVVLTNLGNSTLKISSIAVTGTDAGDFTEKNDCGSSLPPKAHCTMRVTFKPAKLGPRNAVVAITDNAPGSPQTVPLNGIGATAEPNATLSTKSLTFAIRLVSTTSPARPVTLSNYGTETLDITNIVASGDFSELNNCGSSLPPGGYCTINVTFKPTQRGHRTGTVSITDNAPNSPQTVRLNGVGTVVELNPASLDLGTVKVGQKSSPQNTTLTNVGNTTLHITNIAIRGTDPQDFSQMNNCPKYLGGTESCTITVTFQPTQRGARSADVSVSDDGGGSPQQVTLGGAGCIEINNKCKTDGLSGAPVRSALAAYPISAVPIPTGPSSVGTRVVDLVDSTRNDPFLANGAKRELLVRFWYPASLNQGCEPAEYTSPRVWSYFSELVGIPLPEVRTNSCWNAPITDGAHPVVVFTHGYTGTFTDYTFIFEDLASRGYVVASVDHTYEATAVEFPDGRFVKSLVGSHFGDTWRLDDQTLAFALSVRLADLHFVVNELGRLNAKVDGLFAGKLDTSRIALVGHSLGGEATISGMQQETRFRAGVLLDGVLSDDSVRGTDKAILILAAGRGQWSKDECRLWSDLRGPRLAVNLEGAEHMAPSDAVWLAKGAIKAGAMGPEKTIIAIRNYIAAFLDTNLRGSPADPLLSGPSSDYPDAAVTTQKQLLCGRP